MKSLRYILFCLPALGLGLGVFLLQQKLSIKDQRRVELTKSLKTQQEELVKATREAGGDVPAVLTKFREAHAKKLEEQEAAELARLDVPSLEREQMRKKASERVQMIHEIQEQLKAGKDPSEIVPPE